MKKQNIFIDFDGTICFDYFWRSAPDAFKQKFEPFLFRDNGNIVEDWMRGNLTSEQVCHFISENRGLNYEDIFEIFVNDCETMIVKSEILMAIDKCRKNNNVFLITDNMDSFTRFTEPRLKLKQHFDKIYNSADYGKLKDDSIEESLFTKALSDSNSDIKKSVLLDNSKRNCEIFKKLGGTSFCVDSAEHVLTLFKMLE